MEDVLKEMRKRQTIDTLVKLRGSVKYTEEIPPAEVLSDISRTPDGVSRFKGSRSFFSDVFQAAHAVKDIIGEKLYEEIRDFTQPLKEELGKEKLASQEAIDKAHQYIDLILGKLVI